MGIAKQPLAHQPRWRISLLCFLLGPTRLIVPRYISKCHEIFQSPTLFFTAIVAAPVLERQLGPVRVEGSVVEVDPLPEGYRIVVEPRTIERLDAAHLPLRLRVRVTRGGDDLLPGEFVSLRAILYPPPAPAMPGAYDFQRRAYFDRLGAVGFAVSPVERRVAPEGEGPAMWRIAVASLRSAMTERILAALPGRTGGVAAAIITGQTHAIPEADAAAFRDAGLARILRCATPLTRR